MAHKWSLPVRVVVAGQQPVQVQAERLRAVSVFIERVLHLGELPPYYPKADNWELRDADGRLIDPGIKVADAEAIREGATLYLNPRAGVGA